MSTYDIIFDNSKKYSSNDIVFNDVSVVIPSNVGLLNLSVLSPTLKFKGVATRFDYQGNLTLTALAIKFSVKGIYDVNNPFEWYLGSKQSLQEARAVVLKSHQSLRNSLASEHEIFTKFKKAKHTEADYYSTAEKGIALDTRNFNKFQKAETLKSLILNSSLQSSVTLAILKNQSIQKAELLRPVIYKTSLQKGKSTFKVFSTDYQKALPVEKLWDSFFNLSSMAVHNFIGKFEKAEELGNPKTKVVITPPETVVDKSNNDIIFKCLAKEWEQNSYDYTIIFNDTCELKINQPTDFREPIFVKNTFSLKNLETGQEIEATDLSFSTDQDSYSWTGSMTLPDNQIEFLKSPTNKPVLVEYLFNDIKAVFQVGKVSRNITFGQRSYKVKLSSPTIKFDEPISLVDSYTNQDTLTPNAYAEQLLDQTNNGVGLVWDFLSPLEWVINKGAFTYQNLPPIKAIGAMLENSGAFISSSLDGNNLVVKRKRPLVFWEAVDSSKIINIPTGVITSLGYEIEHLQHFNGVYVLADDRTVFIKRRDTNGATLAPQVVAKHLTSNQACVETGRYVLANAGIVETHDLAKPILNDGVLLNPADVVKFVLDDITYIGTVISTSVAIKFNSQYQTFKVEVIKGFN